MCLDEWGKLSNKLAALPITDASAQAIHRLFTQWATDCKIDKQGRILLPQKLRTFAMLEGEITMVATTNRIEIWNNDIFEAINARMEEQYSALLEKAIGLGI